MQIGLLWFDNSPGRTLEMKVEDAAHCYQQKFGLVPDTCYVNRAALNGREFTVPFHEAKGVVLAKPRTLRVVPAGNILPHHFWIGIEQEQGPKAACPS